MSMSWSVFSMVKDTRPMLERFVEHHLSAGASYVHLFFDDPSDPEFDHFARQPGVIAKRCDADHWNSALGWRPKFQEKRQLANGALAYEKCLTDWQAHVDSDELLLPGSQRPLHNQLSDLSSNCPAVWFETIEPLIGQQNENGQTPFRRALLGLNRRQRHRLYGEDLKFLRRGLLGHFRGKSMLRQGLHGWSHGIHLPERPKTSNLHVQTMTSARLAHMHCEDKLDWIQRTIRRTVLAEKGMNLGRYELLPQLHQHHEDPDRIAPSELLLSNYFDRVSVLTDRLKRRLERFGLLEYHLAPSMRGADHALSHASAQCN
ncbi:glycosyltransferase family 2 protein [Tropicibacter sp. Alg240-R139]|uniref:glycosyltransferase family 2 protein n=1 Tax=Tropicibacter sp. Alg240-R139 TaxID=2305991 RepID=UPI0013E0E08C|nr:glycosyltransferase family 2 protein [Tropicibacter sp. Alg240-R139]